MLMSGPWPQQTSRTIDLYRVSRRESGVNVSTGSSGSPASSEESNKERLDRELTELLNGLRVLLPGVQVLLAFLFIVPFSSRFAEANTFQLITFYVTLVATGLAVAMLVTPAAQHRVLFRAHEKSDLLKRANRYALLGSLATAASISAGSLLIIDFVFRGWFAWATSLILLSILGWAWFIQPALHLRRQDQ